MEFPFAPSNKIGSIIDAFNLGDVLTWLKVISFDRSV
jgi:hypothetical protein